jgi:hypothetical protein
MQYCLPTCTLSAYLPTICLHCSKRERWGSFVNSKGSGGFRRYGHREQDVGWSQFLAGWKAKSQTLVPVIKYYLPTCTLSVYLPTICLHCSKRQSWGNFETFGGSGGFRRYGCREQGVGWSQLLARWKEKRQTRITSLLSSSPCASPLTPAKGDPTTPHTHPHARARVHTHRDTLDQGEWRGI